jgi:hypothetical protein
MLVAMKRAALSKEKKKDWDEKLGGEERQDVDEKSNDVTLRPQPRALKETRKRNLRVRRSL